MYHVTIRHWLPRITNQLITALAAAHTAAENGDHKAQRTAEQDAAQFAHIAWRAIGRAGKPRGIAAPVMRAQPRRNDIHLHPKPFGAHPALPPRNARPI